LIFIKIIHSRILKYYKMTNKLRIAGIVAGFGMLAACGGDSVKRTPGKVYMPDMSYSRAYETYADQSNLEAKGISYNNQPVAGTVSRTQDYVYHIAKDEAGVETNYNASAAVPNPVQMLSEKELEETKRLYLVNCGICHGTKLDGNGPLWKDGAGPYPAKPATLKGDAKYEEMTEGMMFYSITYGRNLMGAYASSLTPIQRWNIVHYIKLEQGKKSNGTGLVAKASTPAAVDTATAK
jgi:mono/diheme cytochrome c family protein